MISPDMKNELTSLGVACKENEPLAAHTTWGIGGPADVYAEVKSREQLKTFYAWARRHAVPVFPLGNGSNLLIGDGGVRGAALRLRGEFEALSFQGDEAWAGAGVMLPALARQCAEQGLSGAEPLAGIPGTLGGGLMTNAGTREGALGDLVEQVEVFDLEKGAFALLGKKDLSFSYRQSNLTGTLVLGARLKLRRGDKNVIMANVEKRLKTRAETQPLSTRNCGSVFKNPPGDFAARLIEAAGLKGLQCGGVRVSPRHANFFENTGRATARDARELIEKVRGAVFQKFGARLELEVWLAGEE